MRIASALALGILFVAMKAGIAQEKPEALAVPADALADSAPPPPPPAMQADCHGCKQGGAHLQHLCAWVFYRPPAHCCCNCLPKPVPCCTPPLYTWFPCQGFGRCSSEGCTSCGEAAGPCKTDCYRFFHGGKE